MNYGGEMNPKGLFVGITTVDLQYLVDAFPEENLKTIQISFIYPLADQPQMRPLPLHI